MNLDIESTVITDEYGSFLGVAEEYRVENVMVGEEPLDLEKMYTVASIDYLLVQGGSGMSMFPGNEMVKESLYLDSDVLIFYIRDVLNGVIGAEYENPNGTGRITIGSFSKVEETEEEYQSEVVEEIPEIVEIPEIPEETVNITYIVKSGDNLSYIARDFLGSAQRWDKIYAYNKDIIKNQNMIYVGQVLHLPAA